MSGEWKMAFKNSMKASALVPLAIGLTAGLLIATHHVVQVSTQLNKLKAQQAKKETDLTELKTRYEGLVVDRNNVLINAHMLETGMAYYTVYSSQPAEHRAAFRTITESARREKRGVWATDSTNEFTLGTLEDVTEKQLILPKLFRRAVVYFQDREKGFDGTLADWFAAYPNRDDRLEIGERRTKLSSILEVNGDRVRVLTDILDVVLFEN